MITLLQLNFDVIKWFKSNTHGRCDAAQFSCWKISRLRLGSQILFS